jgi:ABC-type bacteriocin/lantibiotic exporter with double-glycine peptidase domain
MSPVSPDEHWGSKWTRENKDCEHPDQQRGELMSAISLENVTKRFGSMRAVDGVSLSAEEGSLLVLFGPSGCENRQRFG